MDTKKTSRDPTDSYLFGPDSFANQSVTVEVSSPDLRFNSTLQHIPSSSHKNNKNVSSSNDFAFRKHGTEPPTLSILDKEKDLYHSSSNSSSSLSFLKVDDREASSAEWANWVVVLGLDPKLNKLLLSKLNEYGSIAEFVQGEGNYILIKFESPLYAEAASFKGYLVVSTNTIVGIKRMTLSLSKSLGISLVSQKIKFNSEENSFISDRADSNNDNYYSDKDFNAVRNRFSSTTTPFTLNYISRDPVPSTVEDEEDIFLRPYKRKSICEKLLECFWSY